VQTGTRRYLADYFADMAEWHSHARRADDAKPSNGSELNAGSYRRLADYIVTLPEDDLRLIALERLTGFDEEIGFSPGPRVSAAIADVGRFSDGSPEPFLEYLVQAALDDQLEGRNHTTQILIESVEGTTLRP